MRFRLSLDRELLVVSRGGMLNDACPAMPRGSWQRPTSRLSAASYPHASPSASLLTPGSAKAASLAAGTDEDEGEAEGSSGCGSSGSTTFVAAPITAVRCVVGGAR
jgi:hypothetical protein